MKGLLKYIKAISDRVGRDTPVKLWLSTDSKLKDARWERYNDL